LKLISRSGIGAGPGFLREDAMRHRFCTRLLSAWSLSVLFTLCALFGAGAAQAQPCGTPGRDGTGTITGVGTPATLLIYNLFGDPALRLRRAD
jgi:hypothetical protein